ncbi:AAA family ATPase [Ammonifex thiophilus]|uniref:AAA family ATPase n=1 Tax=Ammonifex thiophilus TaxID=444093 RepID=UPI0014026844|nr:response regulator [Ammonifex thiophilus]
MAKIRVLIADDVPRTREEIKRLLAFEEDIVVVGEAGDGEEALRLVEEQVPDVVLMDINMPGLDGIAATEAISERFPQTGVVIISIQGEQEYLRRAMAAGASDYLIKPFTAQEMVDAVRRVWEKNQRRRAMTAVRTGEGKEEVGRVVVFFGSKGGVGRTTLACNLAVLLARRGKRVSLVDFDLASGDVALFFNLDRGRGVAELALEPSLTPETIEGYLLNHVTGVKILRTGEFSEETLPRLGLGTEILTSLKVKTQYVLVDTPPFFCSLTEEALLAADEIVVVGRNDLPGLRRLKTDLQFLKEKGYTGRIWTVLNQVGEEGVDRAGLEKALGMKLKAVLPVEWRACRQAVNKGNPLVLEAKGTRLAQALENFATQLSGEEADRGFWRKVLRR